ncbi:MAG TPA: tail fiber protein [Patescibacteria group bacterium]|nr:tail fiber protein [Patescibacteria group bacterium]
MSSPFVAEIRILACNFPPTGWAFCDGQILPISQNTALFSLLGTTYGGNGQSTFALPDLQGNAPMQPGQGPGLSQRFLGEASGSETVTLLESEIPSHAHGLLAQNTPLGGTVLPAGSTLSRPASGFLYDATSPVLVPMAAEALAPAGGDQPHNNMMPYLTLNFCIALQGIFPPRP